MTDPKADIIVPAVISKRVIERSQQEAEWFRQGLQAAYAGKARLDWPRPAGLKSDSRLARRIRASWHAGYDSATNGNVEVLWPIESSAQHLSIQARLVTLIIKRSPITLRQLIRSFSSRYKQEVIDLISDWYDKDNIEVKGNGRKSSPVTIMSLKSVPDAKQSPRPSDSSGSAPELTPLMIKINPAEVVDWSKPFPTDQQLAIDKAANEIEQNLAEQSYELVTDKTLADDLSDVERQPGIDWSKDAVQDALRDDSEES